MKRYLAWPTFVARRRQRVEAPLMAGTKPGARNRGPGQTSQPEPLWARSVSRIRGILFVPIVIGAALVLAVLDATAYAPSADEWNEDENLAPPRDHREG